MLSRYAAWQTLGRDPLPRGRKALERLQVFPRGSDTIPLVDVYGVDEPGDHPRSYGRHRPGPRDCCPVAEAFVDRIHDKLAPESSALLHLIGEWSGFHPVPGRLARVPARSTVVVGLR